MGGHVVEIPIGATYCADADCGVGALRHDNKVAYLHYLGKAVEHPDFLGFSFTTFVWEFSVIFLAQCVRGGKLGKVGVEVVTDPNTLFGDGSNVWLVIVDSPNSNAHDCFLL